MKEQGLAYKDENLQSILHGGIDELLETDEQLKNQHQSKLKKLRSLTRSLLESNYFEMS